MFNLSSCLHRPRRWVKSALLGIVTLALVLGFNILPQAQLTPLRIAQAQSQVTALGGWKQASFPVENFQRYTSGFGYRTHPVTGKRAFHNGLDIAAPLGSYIRSWWSGKVVGLSDGGNCGTMIRIKSGDWEHTYCHLSGYVTTNGEGTYLMDRNGGIQLWLGQEVSAGTRIGRIGMTGRTTGPHLHWSLKHAGKLIDPAVVLRAMYNQPTASLDRTVQPT